MANYFDRVLYLYPGIQNVVYWKTQYDGQPWKNPYDGLVWENPDIAKPSQAQLDALDDAVVTKELANRAEQQRKLNRDVNAKLNLALIASFTDHAKNNPGKTFSQYLDDLEAIAQNI